jgi:hypothetical protein
MCGTTDGVNQDRTPCRLLSSPPGITVRLHFLFISPRNYSPTALSLPLPLQLQFDCTSLRMLAQAKQAKERAEKRAITLTREIEKQEENLQERLQQKLTSCVRDRSSLTNAENTIQLRYDSNLNAIELRLFLNIVCYANLKLVTELSHCTIESIATICNQLVIHPSTTERRFWLEYHDGIKDKAFVQRLWLGKRNLSTFRSGS